MRKTAILLALTVLVMMVAPAAVADDASATLYKSKCAMCHAADGAGTPTGQKMGTHDFRSPEIQKMTDAQLIELTAKGKNKMPAYDKKLTADEIKGLVAYIRELGKKK
jgi:cytochrome c6